MGVIMGLGAMTFWGAAIFFAAIASHQFENVIVLFWMELFGFLLSIIYFIFNLHSFNFSTIYPYLPHLVTIALLQMIAYLAFYKGLAKAQVSLVSAVGASWGLLAAILGVIFLKEVLKNNQIIAIVIIISGIILVSVNLKDLLKNKKIKLLVGVKEGLIAMMGWGISLFLLASLTKIIGWFLPAFIFRFLLLLFLSVYILFSKKTLIPKKTKFPIWLLLTIGVFDVAGFFTFSLGTSSAYASIVAPIGSAYILVTIILAKIFLKEKIKTNQMIGIIGIIVGLVLISL